MALRYWVGGTGTWDNVAGTKWSATSGGAGGASAPTAADDVFFDGNSGSGTVTTAATATCLTANFTGFTGTFNAATNWTIQTSLTFGAGMTITGTGSILKQGNGGTWTFNGRTYTGGWALPSGGGFSTTIGDDLTFVGSLSAGISGNTLTATAARIITVGGSLLGSTQLTLTNVSFVMNGSGNISGTFFRSGGLALPSITINTPGGTINHNGNFILASIVFTYVAGNWNSTSTIQFTGAAGANIVNNVSTITFAAMAFAANNGQSVTLNSDMYVTGGLGNGTTNSFINGTGRLYIGGNITPTQPIGGTAIIEMYGATNANLAGGTLINSLIINKATSGTTVTLTGNLIWGGASKELVLTTGTFLPQNFGISVPNSLSVTISGMTFWNLTLGTSVILAQNALNTIQNLLTCNGTTTFTGTHGWTAARFSAQAAASVLTFQNINANPLAEYRVTQNLTIIGTALSRITLQAAGSASFTGTANGTTLTRASGTVPSIGMTISQATGTAPAGLLALFPSRPVINGGADPNFTLDLNVTPSTGSIAMRAGYKAVFILENNGVATQNVAYTTCQDIDSSLGQPIFSFASNNDDQATNVSLFRTINWGPLDPPPVQGRNYSSVYIN